MVSSPDNHSAHRIIPHTPSGAITARARKRIRGGFLLNELIFEDRAAIRPAAPGIHIDTASAIGRYNLKKLTKKFSPVTAAIRSSSTAK
jgi:hypothetical protein